MEARLLISVFLARKRATATTEQNSKIEIHYHVWYGGRGKDS